MLIKKYNSIMEKPEEHRNRWALGLTIALSVLIFTSFSFYKGYLSFGGNNKDQVASVISAKSAPSPLQNSKEAFMAAFDEINKQYREFTNSVSDVLVPFITGIDVYERK